MTKYFLMKEYRLNVRISDKEFSALDRAASEKKLSRSEYVREVLDDSFRFKSREKYALDKQLISEVNHIGININQIAKNNNSKLYFESDKKKLLMMMNELLELLKRRTADGDI